MGHVYQTARLKAERTKEVRMFVDTGATYATISPELADELGVRRAVTDRVELADGTIVNAEFGVVSIEIDDRSAATTVAILACQESLLGAEALEVLGLAVDPTEEKLIAKRSWTARAPVVSPGH